MGGGGSETSWGLHPPAYHREVVAYLKREEPDIWAWASSLGEREHQAAEVRAQLLRETYRLTPVTHPDAYATATAAAAALQIEPEVTLYQANAGVSGGGSLNAQLRFLPGEAHLVLMGPVMERLSAAEFTALIGHELAHFKLWAADGGDYFTAMRILQHVLADPGATAGHAETARLYDLHTEIYADRGGALAAADAAPAITCLVKVHTDAANVDAAAYLTQAAELETADPAALLSQGVSHPELFLRARALDKWWRGEADAEAWLDARLQGPLSLNRLDLTAQQRLSDLTRRFIAGFITEADLEGEATEAQARAYFPDWSEAEPTASAADLTPQAIDDSVRDYLGHVMLDFALVDPEQKDHALGLAARRAAKMGGLDAFLESLKRDVGVGRRELAALTRQAKAS